MHLIPMGLFSRWLSCTSEVRKDKRFFMHFLENWGEGELCVTVLPFPSTGYSLVSQHSDVWDNCVLLWKAALSCLNGNWGLIVCKASVHCCEILGLHKNLVLLASCALCPSPRQASDVKGSEVIAKGRVLVFHVYDCKCVFKYLLCAINNRSVWGNATEECNVVAPRRLLRSGSTQPGISVTLQFIWVQIGHSV